MQRPTRRTGDPMKKTDERTDLTKMLGNLRSIVSKNVVINRNDQKTPPIRIIWHWSIEFHHHYGHHFHQSNTHRSKKTMIDRSFDSPIDASPPKNNRTLLRYIRGIIDDCNSMKTNKEQSVIVHRLFTRTALSSLSKCSPRLSDVKPQVSMRMWRKSTWPRIIAILAKWIKS